MTNHEPGRELRYSLKTLHALYDGSTDGSASARGELRLTITTDHHTYTASILSIGTRLTVQEDNGTVHRDVKPSWVTHAEVV